MVAWDYSKPELLGVIGMANFLDKPLVTDIQPDDYFLIVRDPLDTPIMNRISAPDLLGLSYAAL